MHRVISLPVDFAATEIRVQLAAELLSLHTMHLESSSSAPDGSSPMRQELVNDTPS